MKIKGYVATANLNHELWVERESDAKTIGKKLKERGIEYHRGFVSNNKKGRTTIFKFNKATYFDITFYGFETKSKEIRVTQYDLEKHEAEEESKNKICILGFGDDEKQVVF